ISKAFLHISSVLFSIKIITSGNHCSRGFFGTDLESHCISSKGTCLNNVNEWES
ncbi:hypothetical protein C0J52_14097, partial [Blattella germanica]